MMSEPMPEVVHTSGRPMHDFMPGVLAAELERLGPKEFMREVARLLPLNLDRPEDQAPYVAYLQERGVIRRWSVPDSIYDALWEDDREKVQGWPELFVVVIKSDEGQS